MRQIALLCRVLHAEGLVLVCICVAGILGAFQENRFGCRLAWSEKSREDLLKKIMLYTSFDVLDKQ